MERASLAAALLIAALSLAGCGGDQPSATAGSGGAGSRVELEAAPDGSPAYTADSVRAAAGRVTIEFTNPQPIRHDVAIEGAGGETIGRTDVIGEGADSVVVELEPREYTFYCTVPRHREAGMEGTLTVE